MAHPIHSPNSPYPPLGFLFDAVVAPVKLAVMETALELDMAHILSTTSKVDEIAEKAGIQTGTAGLVCFLDAMVAIGLANKENDLYTNTDTGTHFFDKQSPVYLGRYIPNMKELVQKNLADMAEIIKTGILDTSQIRTWENESRWISAAAHLATGQRAGIAAVYADLVQELPGSDNIKKILDLGGGPGLIGAEILGRIPGATGVLIDLPAVIGTARQQIEQQGMTDRISFIAGDYNKTDLGCGYDLIWASHNLYFVKDRVSFFKRVKAALADNGRFACLHEGLVREQTAPCDIVLMRLSSALESVNAPGGHAYTFNKGEIASYLEQAGFKQIDSRMVLLPSGEAEFVTAS
ncbi:class I SAM-dependent methyltransferase [uncultured Desulfobacter sp.]|uniref:class I SAM-dependent methyltransferase n=1 Tax=uncultured Desulfobacter sp. TaxID=240139 RepID=UPI002AAC3432|nr:class I SAM-dependent methyltransferase [uncultured Desulfobacter sp.]